MIAFLWVYKAFFSKHPSVLSITNKKHALHACTVCNFLGTKSKRSKRALQSESTNMAVLEKSVERGGIETAARDNMKHQKG